MGAHALGGARDPAGHPDLDVWIERSAANAGRTWQALASFGDSTVVQVGLPPNRVDVMTAISGVPDFETAWTRRVDGTVRGRTLPFLGRADLITNKRAAGRPKDLVDLAALEGPQ